MTMANTTENLVPKVSVISIALKSEEFLPIIENLSRQTYQDYEFVGEAGGTIPEAWNRAIQRARGELVVLTETDATPLDERWLEEMVTSLLEEKMFVKGLEVTSTFWNLSNLAIHRKAFFENQLDESFGWAADHEILCRLQTQNYRLVQLHRAPVVHLKKSSSRHYLRRGFLYGLYWTRLQYRYPNPLDLSDVKYASNLFLASLLNLLGLFIGFIIYFPERRYRRK